MKLETEVVNDTVFGRNVKTTVRHRCVRIGRGEQKSRKTGHLGDF